MKTLPFRLHISCFIFLLLAWSPLALGQSLCEQENLRDLPVLAKGRIRPLGVHAAETLKMITGKSHRRQAAALYCQLSFHLPGPALTVRVDHVELEKFLNLAESEKSTLIEPLLAREEALLNELQILTQKKTGQKIVWQSPQPFNRQFAGLSRDNRRTRLDDSAHHHG